MFRIINLFYIKKLYFVHKVPLHMRFVCSLQQTGIMSLNNINRLFLTMDRHGQTEFLNIY
jgi:hypothetical protein